MTAIVDLDVAQKEFIKDNNFSKADAIALAAKFNITPDQFVFFAAFDGTNNDEAKNVAPGEVGGTNVWELSQQVSDTSNVVSRYYPGPGTSAALAHSSWLPAAVTQQVIDAAEAAYRQFSDSAAAWIKNHPGQPVSIALTAFSRGSASAAIFSQLVYERGVIDKDDNNKVLIPPGQVGVAAGLIFDPVTTGVDANLAFAPNADNIVVIKALNEYRGMFQASNYAQPGVSVIGMYGNHCDIGGGYDYGIGAISLQAATQFFMNAGLTIAPVRWNRVFNNNNQPIDAAINIHTEQFDSNKQEMWSVSNTDGFSVNDVRIPYSGFRDEYAAPGEKFTLYDDRGVTVTQRVDDEDHVVVEVDRIGTDGVVTKDIYRYGGMSVWGTPTPILDWTHMDFDAKGVTATVATIAYVDDDYIEIRLPDKVTSATLNVRAADGVSADSISTFVYTKNSSGVLIDKTGDGIDTIKGFTGNDTLKANAGQDTLIGLSGNDTLIGGTGNDVLDGGDGFDTYLWNAGEGHDKVIDVDSNGRFLINGRGVGVLIQQSLTSWSSVDGKVTLTQGANWVLNIEGGGSLNLGASFNDGDYGIHRLALPPADGLDGITKNGDLDPIDQSADPGVQLGYDDLGNVKVSLAPAIGREDTLYGGALNDRINGKQGNDILDGRAGKDIVEGGLGSDIVAGGAGNDALYGNTQIALIDAYLAGNSVPNEDGQGDWLDGGGGADILVGGNARDFLTGGAGADLLVGGAGNDILIGDAARVDGSSQWSVERTDTMVDGVRTFHHTIINGTVLDEEIVGGDDTLYGGKGEDWLYGRAGNDLLDGGNGADVLIGGAGNDTLLGGAGDDVLLGDGANVPAGMHGSDWLDGGDGDDLILGGDGDDVLIGGKGKDTLIGGKGKDTYIFNPGDGEERIDDDNVGEDASIIVFGEGTNKNNLRLRKGSMIVDFGDGDSLHFTSFDDFDPLGSPLVSAFQFADGSSMSWEELLSRGFDIDGTDGDDSLVGTGVVDRIDGKGGDDSIVALDGNDLIVGGAGTDAMDGGAGDDTYVLSLGDSPANLDGAFEAIYDESGDDAIRFGDGVAISDLLTETTNQVDLLIRYGTGQVVVVGGQRGAIERIQFADGSEFSIHSFVGQTLQATQNISVSDKDSLLMGGAGADVLEAYGGNATISGGRGDDLLFGYQGGNTYLYELGDGVDTITDISAKTDAQGLAIENVLKFGKGIEPGDITLAYRGDQLILMIGGSEAVRIKGFDAADALGKHAIDRFEFENGTVLAYAHFLARGFDVAGSDGADLLNGTNMLDRLSGHAGDDFLYAGAGKDHLAGGEGIDTLFGGEDDDIYYFNLGDGLDSIIDRDGANRVVFGPGLAMADMLVSQQRGGDGQRYLDLTFPGGDRLSIQDGEFGYVREFSFSDGTSVDIDTLLAELPQLVLEGGDQDDVLIGFDGDDELAGRGGDDTLAGGAGDDTLSGDAGEDFLQGGSGSDLLKGGTGNDRLEGDAGDDVLYGGAGDDLLIGGDGIDTYYFGIDQGQDIAYEASSEHSLLRLAPGLGVNSLQARKEGNDLVLELVSGSAAFRIANYYLDSASSTSWRVETSTGDVKSMGAFLVSLRLASVNVAQARDTYEDRIRAAYTNHLSASGYTFDTNGDAVFSKAHAQTFAGEVFYSYEKKTFHLDFRGNDMSMRPPSSEWDVNELARSLHESSHSTAVAHSVLVDVAVPPQRFDVQWVYYGFGQPPQEYPMSDWLPDPDALPMFWVMGPDGNPLGYFKAKFNVVVPGYTETRTVYVGTSDSTSAYVETVRHNRLTSGNDVARLFGTGSIDGGAGDDILEALCEIDNIWGMWRVDFGGFLYGNDGNDQLSGRDGDNTYIGGRGTDVIVGGIGKDSYLLLEEDSIDLISDTGAANEQPNWRPEGPHAPGFLRYIAADDYAELESYYDTWIRTDRLVFSPGVRADEISISVDEHGLRLIAPDGSGAIIALANEAVGTGIEYVDFSDGTRLTIGQLLSRVYSTERGTSGNDTMLGDARSNAMYGGEGDDILIGGAGADTMVGGKGSDTYVIDDEGDRVFDPAATAISRRADGRLVHGRGAQFSADGRYLMFLSGSDDVVAGDANLLQDVFIKDMESGVVRRISTDSIPELSGRSGIVHAALSPDGRYVAFANEYMSGSWLNGVWVAGEIRSHIYLHNLETKVTSLVEEGFSDRVDGWPITTPVVFSANGRYLIFESSASNLVPGIGASISLVYAKELATGAVNLVSSTAAGDAAPESSYVVEATADGRYILFRSAASNLIPGGYIDPYGGPNLYVKDMVTGDIRRANVDSLGFGGRHSSEAHLSADGRYVVFTSADPNLTGSWGSQVCIKDLQTGILVRAAADESGQLMAGVTSGAVFAPDGAYVYFKSNLGVSSVGEFLRRNLETGAIDRIGSGSRMQLSADGRFVLLSGGSASSSVYDTETGETRKLALGLASINGNVAFSADGRQIVFQGQTVDSGIGGVLLLDNPFYASDSWIDRVESSVSYMLAEGSGIEELTLTGSADINATGNTDNNTLGGNVGDNILDGGEGNDSYHFELGAGHDTVVDHSYSMEYGNAINRLYFGAGVAVADLSFDTTADGILIRYSDNDSILLLGATTIVDVISRIDFEGGDSIDFTNSAPVLAVPIQTQWATEDFVFSYTVPDDAFTDADADSLSYQMSLSDGTSLPSWLAFDPVTHTLAGTPPNTAAGLLSLQITASDPDGLTATAVFTLDIANHMVGSGSDNTLNGTAMRDHIEGRGDDDVLYGGDGDDYLDGGTGEDRLYGGAGDDTLYGGSSGGDDDIEDVLSGGAGDDSYIINTSSTRVREYAGEGDDTVKSGISYTLGNYLENLELTGSANRNGTGNSLDNRLVGNSGNNTLNGGAGDDVLDGRAGNDVLKGGKGNDIYVFGRGYGSDAVEENDTGLGNADVASFMDGIGTEQLWFRHVGNNLEVSIVGASDKLTIQNWYGGSAYRVEQFRTADGHVLLDSQVENLVQAMAAFAPPAAGQTTLPPTYQAALAPVLAANWQ